MVNFGGLVGNLPFFRHSEIPWKVPWNLIKLDQPFASLAIHQFFNSTTWVYTATWAICRNVLMVMQHSHQLPPAQIRSCDVQCGENTCYHRGPETKPGTYWQRGGPCNSAVVAFQSHNHGWLGALSGGYLDHPCGWQPVHHKKLTAGTSTVVVWLDVFRFRPLVFWSVGSNWVSHL